MATQKEVAEHLDLSDRSVRDLVKRGVFSRDGRSQMDLDACRVAYLRHLREVAAGRSSMEADDEGLDLTAERARVAREQADALAMKNARMRGELIPASEASAAMLTVIKTAQSKLGRAHLKVRGVDEETKQRIADAIAEALEELSMTRVEEELGEGVVDDDFASGEDGD